jgi:hypothetical protein
LSIPFRRTKNEGNPPTDGKDMAKSVKYSNP